MPVLSEIGPQRIREALDLLGVAESTTESLT